MEDLFEQMALQGSACFGLQFVEHAAGSKHGAVCSSSVDNNAHRVVVLRCGSKSHLHQ